MIPRKLVRYSPISLQSFLRAEYKRGETMQFSVCCQCGQLFAILENGVASHVNEYEEIDYDQDRDHVPYEEDPSSLVDIDYITDVDSELAMLDQVVSEYDEYDESDYLSEEEE